MIFATIIILHCVADFYCQTEWMATNKIKHLLPLVAHAATYTGVFVLAGIIKQDGNFIAASLLNGAFHFVVDLVTSVITAKFKEHGKIGAFFNTIGTDQMIHMLIWVWLIDIWGLK